jgi:hypothetical protein
MGQLCTLPACLQRRLGRARIRQQYKLGPTLRTLALLGAFSGFRPTGLAETIASRQVFVFVFCPIRSACDSIRRDNDGMYCMVQVTALHARCWCRKLFWNIEGPDDCFGNMTVPGQRRREIGEPCPKFASGARCSWDAGFGDYRACTVTAECRVRRLWTSVTEAIFAACGVNLCVDTHGLTFSRSAPSSRIPLLHVPLLPDHPHYYGRVQIGPRVKSS